jgi:hypothetical protein
MMGTVISNQNKDDVKESITNVDGVAALKSLLSLLYAQLDLAETRALSVFQLASNRIENDFQSMRAQLNQKERVLRTQIANNLQNAMEVSFATRKWASTICEESLSSVEQGTVTENGSVSKDELPSDEIPLVVEPKQSSGRFSFILAELNSELKRVQEQLDTPVKDVIDELLSGTYDVPN